MLNSYEGFESLGEVDHKPDLPSNLTTLERTKTPRKEYTITTQRQKGYTNI